MTLQSRGPRVCIVSVYRWEKCTSTTICRFQMLFQFGWYFFFCCILFTTWVSVSVSIYLFTATSHSVKASPLLLCICLEDARWTWSIFSGTYLLLVAERFPKNALDILTIFQFFLSCFIGSSLASLKDKPPFVPGARVLHAFVTVFPTAGKPGNSVGDLD